MTIRSASLQALLERSALTFEAPYTEIRAAAITADLHGELLPPILAAPP